MMHNWLLPEYIEDMLPAQALRFERTRRQLLDWFNACGYQLVVPPMLEYLPSLLSGTGRDMDLKTFKVVDQLSGRLMGLRADITPQAARIDAHLLNRQGVVRLCYAGSVLHTLPDGQMQTREPLQIGAELFGHAGIESDVEIQQLMLKALQLAGIESVQLDLGHVAIFHSLIEHAAVAPEQEVELFQAMRGKDIPALVELTASLNAADRDALRLLPRLYGGMEVLDEAQKRLPDYPEIRQALNDLRTIGSQVQGGVAKLCFDLAELRGYHYHSGVVFAAYAAGWANAVALGGRYDEVGKTFGRPRPATGFSMDLRAVIGALPNLPLPKAILAPYVQDGVLQDKINLLRSKGEIVVLDLPGHEISREELNYDRVLVQSDGGWVVVEV
jgi:ATP phosphoribosyltransferase regulatory subunit